MWLLEVRAGVYVGRVTRKTREMIWESVVAGVEQGNVVMIWRSPTPSGFEFRTVGSNRRIPVDFDGLTLVQMVARHDDLPF